MKVNWKKQHCGIIQGSIYDVLLHMPDLEGILKTFPKNPFEYTWDVKVHMLMPKQFPCIPNWHRDMVPRDEDGNEVEEKIQPEEKMWLWVSGDPLTEFKREDGSTYLIKPKTWTPFTQLDWHRGTAATEFGWRGLIRACPHTLDISNKNVNNPFGVDSPLRRHSQVYLDAENFSW